MQVTTCVLLWILLCTVAQIDGRPQELETPEVTRVTVKKQVGDAWQNLTANTEDVRSRNDDLHERDIKGLHQMNQSLQTVTTQLLNVSATPSDDAKTESIESKLNLLIKKPEALIMASSRENTNKKSELSSDSSINYRRPGNSKFSHFQTSHPGHAMALTEEELEQELAGTFKQNLTTPGGISTWILLNPPSTTSKPSSNPGMKPSEIKSTWTYTKSTPSASVKIDTTLKADLKATMEKTTSTVYHDPSSFKTTLSTLKMEKLTTVGGGSYTTPKINAETASLANDKDDVESKAWPKSTTPSQTTLRSSYTTPKATTIVAKATTMKVIRPSQLNRPLKPSVVRKPTVRPDTKMTNATSKIEKVTFKPIQTINPIDADKPVFVSKIHASIKTESNDNFINSSSSLDAKKDGLNNMSLNNSTHVVGKGKPVKTSVIKVQLKKPVDSPTTIEIEPIQVNAPVLTIEKVEDKKESKISPIELDNAKIDVKFDFNPELTRFVETLTETTTPMTTTKKPKRKKNKIKRRKPSTTAAPISTTPTTTTTTTQISNLEPVEEEITEAEKSDTSLQESKIIAAAAPSSLSSNNTKNKKKQVQKPISTQIYNFLSREVMPSVGVMSLVGLGLGLASYFLYPFGGAISRRNYDVEPNYKYNFNEYGGNYGQNEEEVLSKVFQGMNHDGKYGGMKDYEKNYYRYQAHDTPYNEAYTTRKNIPPAGYFTPVPVYKPADSPVFYDTYHRNTDLKLYSDLPPPTTLNYFDRPAKTQFLNQVSGDRQFVVGNIPKEYDSSSNNNNNNDEKDVDTTNHNNGNIDNNNNDDAVDNISNNDNVRIADLISTTESVQTEFEKQIAQNLQFIKNPINIPQNFAQTEAVKANEAYDEEIEITPTAVAVEHGPRFLKLEKLDSDIENVKINVRRKRESSVIQQIPSRKEIENEEKEEDLSNEILDIIDSAISTEVPVILEKDKKSGEKIAIKDKQNEIENEVITKISREKQATIINLIDVTPKIKESNKDKTKNTSENDNSTFSTTLFVESTTPITNSIFEIKDNATSNLSNNTLHLEDNNINVTRISITAPKPPIQERFNLFNFVKTLAEVKLRLGLTILKHASENFAKYIGNVQKRLNGED